MPNWCFSRLSVIGRKECVDELVNILNAKYNYTKEEFSHIPHMFRCFLESYDIIDTYGLLVHADIFVNCAWSVYSCMFNGPGTYYDDYITDRKRNKYGFATNILEISKNLGLWIEIWSEEEGFCFEEHYIINQGILIKDEEYNIGITHFIGEYNNYHDYKEDYEKDAIPEEKFNKLMSENVYSFIPDYKEWEYDKKFNNVKPNYMFYKVMFKKVDKK